MSTLGKLVVSLVAETAQFTQAMSKAEMQTAASMASIEKSVSWAGTAIKGLVAGFSATMVLDWARNVTAGASALDDLADSTGSSVESLSKLKNQATIAGASFEDVSALVLKLSLGMSGMDEETSKAGHALEYLGISTKDPAQALQEIAQKLDGYQDGLGKIAIARDLFGKQGPAFLAQLKDIAKYHDVAATVTAQQAAEAEKLEQNLRRLKVESTAMSDALLSKVIPAINNTMEAFKLAREQGTGFMQSVDFALRSGKEYGDSISQLQTRIAGMQQQLAGYKATTNPSAAAYGTEVASMTAELEKAQKALQTLIKLRDQNIFQNLVGQDTLDKNDRLARGLATASQKVMDYKSALDKTKGSTYDYGEELQKLYNKLDNTATSVSDEFYRDLEMLRGEFAAGEMTLEKYRERVEALIKSTKFGADAIKDMEDAAKANNKAFDDAFDIMEKERLAKDASIRSARLMVEQLEFENTTLGMTNKEREIAIALRQLELDGLKKGSDAYELMAVRIRAAIEQKDQIQASANYWKEFADTATSALETLFTQGKNGAKSLWDSFKSYALHALAELASTKLVIPIAASIMSGGASASGGVSTALGGGSGGAGSLLSTGASLASTFTSIGSAAGTFISVLGTGAPIGQAFSMAMASTTLTLGSLVPVIGTIAAAAYALYTILEKSGGPKSGGYAASGSTPGIYGTDNSGRWFTPSDQDAAVQKIVDATAGSYAQVLKSLGGSGSAAFALGFDTDPEGTAPNRVHSGAWVNGRQVYNAALGDLGRDNDKLQATLDLESKRALVAALQASDLPDDIARILDSVNASTATADMIDRTLDFASAVKSFGDVLERNPVADAMEALTIASEGSYAALKRSGDSMRSLIDDYDGSADATRSLASATQAYYQQQVALLVQIEQVRQSISTMFGDTIRSLTLTTLNDGDKYNYLRSEADRLMAQLSTETDPQKIQDLASRINQDIMDAFGLLDPDQQRSALASYTAYAQSVNDAVSTRLKAIGDDARTSVAAVLDLVKGAFNTAVDNFANAAGTQADAAATQLAAAQTPLQVNVVVSETPPTVNG